MSKVSLGLFVKTRPEVIAMSENITTMMTGNADYTDPNPALVAVTSARTNEENGAANIMNLESQLAEARLQQVVFEIAHNTLLTNLGTYAQNAVLGNGPKLEGGGFPLARTPEPVGPLPAPINIRAVAGPGPGECTVSCKAVEGRLSYVGEKATTPAGPWTQFYAGGKPRCVATGLTSGTLYYFRMGALGAAGPSPWSDISERRAP